MEDNTTFKIENGQEINIKNPQSNLNGFVAIFFFFKKKKKKMVADSLLTDIGLNVNPLHASCS